jgi:hypothetical protein
MVMLDMWYEDREPDFSKGEVLGMIYHNDLNGRYWANILNRDGTLIGDVSCTDSVEFGAWAEKHGTEIDWR